MATSTNLILSLLRLSREISLLEPPNPLLTRHVSSIARKSNLLSLLFEDLHRSPIPNLSPSSLLCLNEILIVLQRFKILLADCSARSRIRLLLQPEPVSSSFHELTVDLSTLLDILPLSDLQISEDVKDLVHLVRRHCGSSKPDPDPAVVRIRNEILELIGEIEQEIVPDQAKLERIFQNLGLEDSRSCGVEIECLEREIGDKVCEKLSSAMVALVGVVRYANCVLFGSSTPGSEPASNLRPESSSLTDLAIPADFRCPISLDMMRDPVVVASGQTYDRESIATWIASGHTTCPKSGQVLAHLDFIPNKALKNLIALYCRERNLPLLEPPVSFDGEKNSVTANKAAVEAARMTASFLIKKLNTSPSTETVNGVVHELRQLTKRISEVRAFVGDASAIPLLVPLLWSEEASLQVNTVTALLNLSILDANKKRIVHADGAIDGVIHVLSEGATWQAKENAATLVLSISAVHSYRRKFGRNQRMLAALIGLVKAGPTSSKKDALAAILSLASDRDNIVHLVNGGVVEAALEAAEVADVADQAVGILAAVAKRGGAHEVGAREGVVLKLVRVLRNGSDTGRENAAAALVTLCRKSSRSEVVAEVARVPGIECVIWELLGSGTERGRRKAASLGRICRRWVAAAEVAERATGFSTEMSLTASMMS